MISRFLALFFSAVFISVQLGAQNLSFPEQANFKWEHKTINIPEIPAEYFHEDAVILEEDFEVEGSFILRHVLVKIQNDSGRAAFKSITLPENFDLTGYPNVFRQGRFSHHTIPYVYQYDVMYFKARRFDKDGNELPLETKIVPAKKFWLDIHGEHVHDNYRKFLFSELNPGDILEFFYKSIHKQSPLVYFLNSIHPKLKLNLSLPADFAHFNFSSSDSISFKQFSDALKVNEGKDIRFEKTWLNLQSVRYPQYAIAASHFPHITIRVPSDDFKRILVDWKTSFLNGRDAYSCTHGAVNVSGGIKIPYFFFVDTTDNVPIYLKPNLAIKKYANSITRLNEDSTGNKWMTAVVSDLNTHKFLRAEYLHYTNTNQYGVSSFERLLKKELTEEFLSDIYENLFLEKKIFYYTVALADKRLRITNATRYDHPYYNHVIYAVPEGRGLIFYVPRYNGCKYHANELPFYLEGQICALFPSNPGALKKKADALKIGISRTPGAKNTENTRTESCVFKVKTDSLFINATIKASISGQFSTLLRHYYSGDIIDSTVNPFYFKKCSDKPNSYNVKIKETSASSFFPFKNSYLCNEQIKIAEKGVIDLKGFYAFLFTRDVFKRKVNHDFYFDFQFSDSYNFLFDFDRAVEIKNLSAFEKKLSNDYFEVFSELVKQDNAKYLLSVRIKTKKDMVPKLYSESITELASLLSELDNMTLQYQ